MININMPQWGMGINEGTINSWNVKVGDKVQKGDILCEIDQSKVVDTFAAFDEGYIIKILVQEGESAECGDPICVIGTQEELN